MSAIERVATRQYAPSGRLTASSHQSFLGSFGTGGMATPVRQSESTQAPCLNQPFSAPRRLEPSSFEPGNSS
jgi:hypothetical protein